VGWGSRYCFAGLSYSLAELFSPLCAYRPKKKKKDMGGVDWVLFLGNCPSLGVGGCFWGLLESFFC